MCLILSYFLRTCIEDSMSKFQIGLLHQSFEFVFSKFHINVKISEKNVKILIKFQDKTLKCRDKRYNKYQLRMKKKEKIREFRDN